MVTRILLGMMALVALPVSGATSYFVGAATEGAFDAAVTANLLTPTAGINFAGATGSGTNTVTQSGQTFLFLNGTLTVSGTNRLVENVGGGRLDVTPGANVYAIGLHLTVTSNSLFCFETPGSGLCELDNDGNSTLGITTSGSFYGIVSSSPIPAFSIRATAGGAPLQITDFKLGTMSVAEAPEPGTMAMVGLGLTVLGLLSRRRRSLPSGAR